MIRGQVAHSPLPLDFPFFHSGMRRLRLKNRHSVKIIWALSLRGSMLTPLSNVTHNPTARESEDGIFYC